jgi:hypothetical protein
MCLCVCVCIRVLIGLNATFQSVFIQESRNLMAKTDVPNRILQELYHCDNYFLQLPRESALVA